ncbi:MAG: fructose-bisphosphate aldolase [Bacilli bacterium]|nr:fructose-bisphosphate aldolase [Bacilli bacterium]
MNKDGFVAALDQSGGSIKKALLSYGVTNLDDDLFEIMHDMRMRVLKNIDYSKINGVIIFEGEVNRKIDGKNIIDYLIDKDALVFVKIDKGLEEKTNGVSLMKDILNLENTLDLLKEKGVYGTKMRSVIYENNILGIRKLVNQQFSLAKVILKHGLIPIIEPEVDINSLDKKECEITLKREIDRNLKQLGDDKVILKLTLPSLDNFYLDYTSNKNVLKVLALSGGYSKEVACDKLSKNKGVSASFSRALLEDLNINQTDNEFRDILNKNVSEIYVASTNE